MSYLRPNVDSPNIAVAISPARGEDFRSAAPADSRHGIGWGAWPFLLLATILIPGLYFLSTSRSGDDASMESFRELLAAKSGEGARDCGDTLMPWPPLTGHLRSACIEESLAAGSAFRASFAWDGYGHGYYTWFGYASDGKGGVWLVRYSPDIHEGYRDPPLPFLDIGRCQSFHVPAKFKVPLFCREH